MFFFSFFVFISLGNLFASENLTALLPSASIAPLQQSLCVNGVVQSLVVNYSETTASGYQWYYNTTGVNSGGILIPGATNSSYTVPNNSVFGTRYYYCIITDSALGSTTNSSVSQITISAMPNITSQPLSTQSLCLDGAPSSLSLSVTNGIGVPIYQWFSNTVASANGGSLISGANGSSYTPGTGNVSASYYYCTATYEASGCASLTSNVSTVNVLADPIISSQPIASQTICAGGTPNSLSVTLIGGLGTTSYQWYSASGNNPIIGQTASSYNPGVINIADVYTYYVSANQTGAGCSVNSNSASINVIQDPVATITPSQQGVCIGGVLTALSVNITGGTGTPVTYAWYWNTTGSNTVGTLVTGATSSTYSPPTTAAFNRFYYCVVTMGGSGCSVNSPVSQVIVAADPTISSQPIGSQTICVDGTPSVLSVTIANGYGTPIYQWFSNTSNSTSGGTLIQGETNSTFIPPSNVAGTRYYYCVVTSGVSGCGSVTSSVSTVTIAADPTISAQPLTSQTICVGGSPSILSVTAINGTGTSTYQWYDASNIAIAGQVSSTFSPGVQNAVGSFSYYAVVSQAGSGCNSVTSSTATVIVIEDPVASITPNQQGVCIGGVLTPLSVNITGGAGTPVNYAWYYNTTGSNTTGTLVSGVNTSTYSPPTTAAFNRYYYCVVTMGSTGCSVNSPVSQVIVSADPTINTQPLSSQNICLGGAPTLSVSLANGYGTPIYQWYSNSVASNTGGTSIGGATNSTYTPLINSVSSNYYYCTALYAASGCGSVTSNSATVNVLTDPIILTQPTASQAICEGGTASLNISASGGTGTFSYLWYNLDTNQPIQGTNSSNFNSGPLTSVGLNSFYCIVSQSGSGCDDNISNPATINVIPDPVSTITPSQQGVCIGGVLTALSVNITGGIGTPVTYAWYWNTTGSNTIGTVVTSATSSTYSPPTTAAFNRYYYCVVTMGGSGCSVNSPVSQVIVAADPTISSQPIGSQTICVDGTPSVLSVTIANGYGTPIYQWFSNTSNSTSGGTLIQGETNSTFIPPSNVAGTRYYYCVVTSGVSGCGSVISGVSTVIIAADPSITVQPLPSQTVCLGGSPTALSVSVANGTGTTSYQWYDAANNPINGQTNSSYTLGVQNTLGDFSHYVVINQTGSGCNSLTSSSATISVIEDPVASITPNQQGVCIGGVLTPLSVNIAGGAGTPVNYAWYYNTTGSNTTGTLVSGVNTSTYSPPTTAAFNRYYYCVVTMGSTGCSVNSPVSQVIVSADPTISSQPLSTQTICLDGIPTNLTVTLLNGYGASTYQWYSNTSNSTTGGAVISGATNATYIPPSNIAGTRYYYCVVTSGASGCGSVTSSASTVIVVADPYVVSDLTSSMTVCLGATISPLSPTFSGGTGSTSYQWYNGNTNSIIPGATSQNYTPPVFNTLGNFQYYLTQTRGGSGCGSVSTSVLNIQVIEDPVVSISPLQQGICVNGVLTPLTVSNIGGSGTASYQWYYNATNSNNGGTIISGATAATYNPPTTAAINRYYYCVITYSAAGCTINSPVSQLVVSTLPSFSTQPLSSQTLCLDGTPSALSVVVANGSGNPNFQWYSNTTSSIVGGVAISNENSANLVPPTNVVGTYYYYCVVSFAASGCGTLTSNVSIVNIVADPIITSQPNSIQTICPGGTPGALSVAISGGTGTTTYQWYNGTTSTQINGQTASTYSPGVINTAGTYTYYVAINQTGSGCNTLNSVTATINVFADPQFVQQPASAGYCQNGIANPLITQINNSTGTINYQWFSNATNSTTGGTQVQNGSSNSYTPPTSALGTRYYYCLVTTNVSGCSSGYSSIATITVGAQPIISSNPAVSQTICEGGTSNGLNVSYTGGAGTPVYTWYVNNVFSTLGATALPNSNSNPYGAQTNGIGDFYYYCTVSFNGNGCNSLQSSISTLNVIADPVITSTSISSSICSGGSLLTPMSLTYIGGIGTPTYQWYLNNISTSIQGATSSTYSPGILNSTGTYSYFGSVMLSGSGCGPIYSQPNTIVVAADPSVSQQPIALQNVCQNSAPQSLVVSANGGLGTFLYQWYSNTSNNTNGALINGANSSTYSPSTSVVGTIYYYCIITQAASGCSVTSSISRLNVLAQPSVVNQPVASQSICIGGALSTLSTSVTGGVGTPTYQWFSSSTNAYAGAAISNATSTTYSPSNATIGTTYYYCVISYSQGSCNSVNTSISTVSVYGLPSITTQPNDYQEVCVGGSGVLSVNPALSGGNMSIQWYISQINQPVAGATSAIFTTPTVTAVNQINFYYAVITWSGSGCGSVTSNDGSVLGIANPVVTTTPSTIQVCQDQQAPPFTSNVSGGFGTTNYQWYYSYSSNLSNGQIIPGATSATYSATNTNPDSIVIATIGSGATETSGTGSDPIDGYATSFRYQVIYTQAELAAAGVFPNSVMKKLGWSVSSDYGSGNLNNYTIKLAQTTNTNSAAHDNSSNSGTVVYTGSYNPTVTAQDAFDLITFQNNYVYQGGNLLVDICSTGNTANTLTAGRVRTMASSTTSGSRYLRTIASCSSSTTTVNSTKPQIQFAICNPSTLYYYVQINQTSGCSVTSSPGTLNVIDAPYLNSSSLQSQTICVGGTIAPLIVTYSNSAVSPSVQWYSNTVNSNSGGQLISNATNLTYTPTNTTVGNMYYYAVLTFSNLASCNVLTTGTANIQILADPQITLQPLSMSSCVSATTSSLIQFTTNYTSNSSAGSTNVQWNLNGIPVIGANSDSYYPLINTVGTFNYTATVSQSLSGCSVTSNAAILTVVADPAISVVGATSYSSCLNEPSPNLTITVSGGSGTISYQWYQNTNQTLTGTPIAGETNSSYLPSTATIGTKYYYCIVTQSGANCGATSSVFTVTTTALPTGVDDAIPATVQLCQNSTSTVLQVGGGTAYAWYRNSTNSYYGATVIGTNSATYSPSTTVSGTYYYFCVITLSAGSCGSLYSNISAVTVNPQPSLIVQPLSQSGCINFTPNALIVQVSGGNTGYGFQWYSNSTNTNSGGVILSGQTSSSYIPPSNQFGTKYYYCIVTNLSTGCSISSSAGSVFVRNNPTVTIPNGNVEVCEGESVLFLATGASTYVWSNSIMNGTSTTNYSQGAYTVTGTDIYGCSANASFSIIVHNLPVVNAGDDIYICPNVQIVLSATGALTYAWSGGVIQNQPFMPNSGYYNVTGTGNFGCTDSDVVYVEVSNAYNPTIVGSITPTVYGGDGAINISVGTINNPCIFDWSNDGLGDSNDTEDIENLNSGTYSVFVTDAIGCEVSQTFTVNEGHELFIPTAISPNGDGYNDSWQILGLSQFDSYEINVFNSQGILVFHRENGYEPWDGTFGSNPLSGDDYVFVIDTEGTDNHIVGYLTITY